MINLDEKILEKVGFLKVIDTLQLSTIFSKPLIYNTKQLMDKKSLEVEYNNIEKCIPKIKDQQFFSDFTHLLSRFRDIRNSFTRCKAGEVLDEVELYEIKNFVLTSFDLKNMYDSHELKLHDIKFLDLKNIYNLLNPMHNKTESFYIYNEYSEKLSEIRLNKSELDKILFKEKDLEKQKDSFKRRAYLINEEKSEEFNVRKMLSSEISKYAEDLLFFTSNIGKLDFVFAKAKLASDYNMCRPLILTEKKIVMKNGIHPIIKEEVIKRHGVFYPISIHVSTGSTVITGANMGGKTVILSIVALNYIMASLGFFSFAESFQFKPLNFISFLYEDTSSLETGLSSFGAEITKLKEILERLANEDGLLLIDEFARGTNPIEGSNLTKALVCYLNKFSSISILSTHYNGVCNLAKQHYQVKGLKAVDFKAIKNSFNTEKNYLELINNLMDYTLEEVAKDAPIPKDALNICSLMGLDEKIIKIADELYREV